MCIEAQTLSLHPGSSPSPDTTLLAVAPGVTRVCKASLGGGVGAEPASGVRRQWAVGQLSPSRGQGWGSRQGRQGRVKARVLLGCSCSLNPPTRINPPPPPRPQSRGRWGDGGDPPRPPWVPVVSGAQPQPCAPPPLQSQPGCPPHPQPLYPHPHNPPSRTAEAGGGGQWLWVRAGLGVTLTPPSISQGHSAETQTREHVRDLGECGERGMGGSCTHHLPCPPREPPTHWSAHPPAGDTSPCPPPGG